MLTFLGLRWFWPASCSAWFYFSSASAQRSTLELISRLRTWLSGSSSPS